MPSSTTSLPCPPKISLLAIPHAPRLRDHEVGKVGRRRRRVRCKGQQDDAAEHDGGNRAGAPLATDDICEVTPQEHTCVAAA
eukprot:364640-Chlamydomonas_euryale.AAC.29